MKHKKAILLALAVVCSLTLFCGSAFAGTVIIGTTDVTDDPDGVLPSGFVLHQNYPNPFTENTTFQFSLEKQIAPAWPRITGACQHMWAPCPRN